MPFEGRLIAEGGGGTAPAAGAVEVPRGKKLAGFVGGYQDHRGDGSQTMAGVMPTEPELDFAQLCALRDCPRGRLTTALFP